MQVMPKLGVLKMTPADYGKREQPLDWIFAYGDKHLQALEKKYQPEFDKLADVEVTFEAIMKGQAHIVTPDDQTYVMRNPFERLSHFFKRILKIASDPQSLKQHQAETDRVLSSLS